jgi:hypothetical protein
MAKTKTNPIAALLVVAVLAVGGWYVVNSMHSTGRAVDTVDKWTAPKRMTKPRTSDRTRHTVQFIVEALPARVLVIHATAGVAQSFGPAHEEAGRWSKTFHDVATGEFAELSAVEVRGGERGGLRCWILIDGKLYRNAGRDRPYSMIRDTTSNPECTAMVVVG